MTMKKHRLKYIDQAKAIGIILIVLGHISYFYGPVNNTASYFKISIFYIISGLLTYQNEFKGISNIKFVESVKHKAKTLLIPYCFYSALALFWLLILGIIKNDFAPLSKGILQTITFRGISTLWFLPSLFLAFVFHDCWGKMVCSIRNNYVRAALYIALIIVVPITMIKLSALPFFEINLIGPIYYICLTLGKGIVAFWFLEIGYIGVTKVISLPAILHVVAFGGGAVFVNIIHPSCIDFNMFEFGTYPILFFSMGIVFSCAIIGLLKASKIKEMVLNRIGLASLFIMATHEPLPI